MPRCGVVTTAWLRANFESRPMSSNCHQPLLPRRGAYSGHAFLAMQFRQRGPAARSRATPHWHGRTCARISVAFLDAADASNVPARRRSRRRPPLIIVFMGGATVGMLAAGILGYERLRSRDVSRRGKEIRYPFTNLLETHV